MSVNFPGSIDTTTTLLNPFNKHKWTSRLKTLIAEAETILTLTDLSDIPADVANNYIGIDDEIMFVASIDNTGSDKKITVTRGQGNSTAAPHSAGVEVLQVYTAEYHKKLAEAIIAIEEYTKSGDMSLDNLTQITTRNHNDLQNLNAGSAHPSASIDNTATSYGRGLSTTDTTIQKVADRVNQNGTPAFKTSKDKCPLMLNFKDGLADSTNGITPIGYNTATKNKADNFISNPDGSLSATLKQFDGDEGKFGSGVAVEESRTNLLLYSDDLTNATWIKTNCTVTLDRVLPDGRKLFKVTAIASGDAYITNSSVTTNSGVTYTFSLSVIANEVNSIFATNFYNLFLNNTSNYKKITKINNTIINGQTRSAFAIGANLKTAGDTFYITSPQLEAGAVPTSYIATGSTAVTRPAGKLKYNINANTSDMSASFWFYSNTADVAANTKNVVIFSDGSNENFKIYKSSNSNNYNLSALYNSSFSVLSLGSLTNGWHRIAFSISNGVITTYIDKVFKGTINVDIKAMATLQLLNLNGNDICNGAISNFAIFNYALTADEIANIYNAGLENKSVELDNGKTVSEADRLSPNIEAGSNKAQFVTDKTKCSLLLDFKGTLADKTRGINPIGSDAANKWTDNYVNDSNIKTSATNISCTLKQFEGDEGKFGSGVAVEESRKNVVNNSQNASFCIGNIITSTNVISPVGNNGLRITANGSGFAYYLVTSLNNIASNTTYTLSFWCKSPNAIYIQVGLANNEDPWATLITPYVSAVNVSSKWQRYSIVLTTNSNAITANTRIIFGQDQASGLIFDIDGIQLEAGAFPTSYIATGATAVTRPANTYSYNGKIIGKVGTLSAWIKYSALGLTNQSMSPFQITSPIYNLFDVYGSTSPYNVRIGGGTNDILAYYFATNAWYLWTVKWDGANIYWYINGILIKTTTQGFDFGNFDYIKSPYGESSACIISNFAIFNYALTADEISQIYNSGLEGKPIAITNPENIIPVGQSLYDTLFVTYTSGWGISSTYPNKPTFSKNDGIGMLRGIVEYSGVVNSDVTLFTLPVGARPSLPDTYYNSFIVSSRDSGAPSARILRVYGNGGVKLMAQGATITNPAISLDGINFINGK